MHRPAEHLYHTSEDPSEMTNLADDPKFADVNARLSAELGRWMESQGDPGVALDTKEAWGKARRAAAEWEKGRRNR